MWCARRPAIPRSAPEPGRASLSNVTVAAIERLRAVVRDSGLVEPGSRGVALLSGGPASACLAAGLTAALGPDAVTGLHLNYGLREDSDQDEEWFRALCELLGIEPM